MKKEDLDFIHDKEPVEIQSPNKSEQLAAHEIDVLTASNEELDQLTVSKEETEKNIPVIEEEGEVDGKDRDAKDKKMAEIKELEELLGIKDANPYRTLNKDIFEDNLQTMSISEMTALAMRVGVQPSGGRNQLRNALRKSFDFYVRKHDVTVAAPARPIQLDKNSPNYKEAVRLLTEL